MATLIRPKRGLVVPAGEQVNLGHPLAHRLVGLWLGHDPAHSIAAGGTGWAESSPPTQTFLSTQMGRAFSAAATTGSVATDGGPSTTLAAWVYVTAYQSSSPFISTICGWEPSSGINPTLMLRFGDSTLAKEKAQFVVGNNTASVKASGNTTNPTNQPVFVAGVYDNVAQTATLYINGRQDATPVSAPNAPSGSAAFGLLKSPGQNRPLNGGAMSVAVWYRALSASELMWLYQEPYALLAPQSPRQRYWYATNTVTGTASAALGSLTATATGKPTVNGTASAVLGLLTATVTGSVTDVTTAAAALGGLAATATGTVTHPSPVVPLGDSAGYPQPQRPLPVLGLAVCTIEASVTVEGRIVGRSHHHANIERPACTGRLRGTARTTVRQASLEIRSLCISGRAVSRRRDPDEEAALLAGLVLMET